MMTESTRPRKIPSTVNFVFRCRLDRLRPLYGMDIP